MNCPHCGEKLKIRSSKRQHILLKQIWLQCTNIKCGYTCAGNIDITHQLSPSAIPNPKITLETYQEKNKQQYSSHD
ncbi:ogr/Delta-like zinc finger family protein [Acinetobacter qingfengensis]|nr:ogr/Delta-like zinc finger family protein [Acinetobacter qingfengensis]